MKIDLKPLSVNAAWQGRRFKTNEYKQFERALLLLLPKMKIPEAPYEVFYEFGFSSPLSDLANPEKLVTDIICKKYSINDKDIFLMHLKKHIVPKGKEFIQFEITHANLS